MKIEYIARKVKITNQVKEIAEKKLAKIEKYFSDIRDLSIEIAQERHLHVVDILLKGKNYDVKATASHKEMTTALHEAIEKLEIQARRLKARLKDHKRHHSDERAWDVDVIEAESAASGSPQIVETSTIPIKPMNIEEAVLQLEKSDELFFVFFDATSEKINVLYRRSDNNLGLIKPDLR